MNEIILKGIQDLVNNIKIEYGIVNEIIRDDVFSILQGMTDCNVLYYPLNDEIGGCHIEKMVNGRVEQFVFINTNFYINHFFHLFLSKSNKIDCLFDNNQESKEKVKYK